MSTTESTKIQPVLAPPETAVEWVEERRRSFEKKADHNKSEALSLLVVILTATTITPLFIAFGEGVFFGKAVPSALSLIATGCTAWLQARRPQQLWGTYRETQRRIEDQMVKHRFSAGEYGMIDKEAADKLIVERVSSIAFTAHETWRGLLPGPESLKTALQPGDTADTKVR